MSRNLSHDPKIPCDNLPLPSNVTTMELTIKTYEWKIFEFTRMLIRPKSDHFLPLSVFLLTDSLTHSCLVDLNEVNLADEDDYLMKAIVW